jgi:hypothetical protein
MLDPVSAEPPLRTGWEPETPAGDTLLRRFLLNLVATCGGPVTAIGGRAERRPHLALSDLGRPTAMFNSAVLLAPAQPGRLGALLGELDDWFAGAGTGAVELWSLWPLPDLRPHGWELDGYPPVMLRPAGGTPRPAPPELRVEPVLDAATLATWEATLVAGFPFEEMVGQPAVFDERVLADGRLRLFLGLVDGRPVATSGTMLDSGVGGVLGVSTLPGARGRGYGEALTWAATMADPGVPAVLVASDDGRGVYERMGYAALLRAALWHRERAEGGWAQR